MTTALRFFMFLAMIVWLGGIIFFAFVAAPGLFSILTPVENGRHLAGMIVNRSLGILHWIGVACGITLLLSSLLYSYKVTGSPGPWALRNGIIVLMLALTLISQLAIAPRMAVVRQQMGAPVDALAASDPRRQEFNSLHRWSTRAEGGVLLLGMALLFLLSKEMA